MLRGLAPMMLLCGVMSAPSPNLRPTIGILSQPVSGDPSKAYIAASYVKFVEAAGAQAVPIQYWETQANITAMVRGVNGVLFPGGGSSLAAGSTFFGALEVAYREVLAAQDGGETVPLWATCLGFEALMLLASGLDYAVLQGGFDSWDLPLPLDFSTDPTQTSLFGGASKALLQAVAGQNVTMNNHHSGVLASTFRGNANLTAALRLVSTNADRQGKVFVSTVEGRARPVFGTQWHPEKNAFEWTPREAIPHSEAAVDVTQWVANRFVRFARRNTRSFGADEAARLVYNWAPAYTALQGSDFTQEYIWDVPAHRLAAARRPASGPVFRV